MLERNLWKKKKKSLETFLSRGRRIKAKVFPEVPLAAPGSTCPCGNWRKLRLLHRTETPEPRRSCLGVQHRGTFDGCEISFSGWDADNRLEVAPLPHSEFWTERSRGELASVVITLASHGCAVKDLPSDQEQTETIRRITIVKCLFCYKMSWSVSQAHTRDLTLFVNLFFSCQMNSRDEMIM